MDFEAVEREEEEDGRGVGDGVEAPEGVGIERREGGPDEDGSGEGVAIQSDDVGDAVPGARNEIEEMGDDLPKDEDEAGEPEVDSLVRLSSADKEQEDEERGEGADIGDEIEVHRRLVDT